MQDSKRRCFGLTLCVASAIGSCYLIASVLWSGLMPGFRRASMVLTDSTYSRASDAAEFWLPMRPLADDFKLQALPGAYFLWLAGILAGYTLLTTAMKRHYLRRFDWQ